MTKRTQLSPLLNRRVPYPDETLASWVWRLVRCNYLESPSGLLDLLNAVRGDHVPPLVVNSLDALRDGTVLQGLAQLSGTSFQDVYNHTLHHFAAHLILPEQEAETEKNASDISLSFWPHRLSRGLYSPRFDWCPSCLSAARYVRWQWHLPMVVSCETHRCWLIEKCPGCDARMREADIIAGQCLTCRFPLAEARLVLIPEDDLLLTMQSTLLKWLDGLPDAMQLGLPPVGVGALLHILLGLRYASQRAGNDWSFHHIPPSIPELDLDILEQRYLTVFERGCLYATAFRGLVDWPQGFYSYLDAYRLRPGQKPATGLRREFGVLHSSWLARYWKHPAFDVIQTAYNDYLVAHVSACHIVGTRRVHDYPDLLQRVEHLNFHHAARYLETSTRTLLRLVDEGHLTVHHFRPHDSGWLSRQELDRLQQRWENHLTTTEAATCLGLYPEIIWGLVVEQLLFAVPANGGVKTLANYIYRDSMLELLQKLKQHTTIQPDAQQQGISLADVCIRNATVGLGTPQILKRICAGYLHAYHPCKTLFPLSDLWFSPEAVENLANIFKEEQNWMNLTETQACLGVQREVVRHLVDADILHPVKSFGNKQFYQRAEVLALRDRTVTSGQAAALLDIPTRHITQLAQYRVLSPISGPSINGHARYIFDRHDLLAWHKQHVLRCELERLVDRTELLKLLKSHRIEPLFKPPPVYLREEVTEVMAVAGLP